MLKVFILITTIVLGNPDGTAVSATHVYPHPMTEADCTDMELATRSQRLEASHMVAASHGTILRHMFGHCMNVKDLLANSSGLKL